MKFNPLNSDDVIRCSTPILMNHTTFTIEDLQTKLRENLRLSDANGDKFNWIKDGIECEVLQALGNEKGWRSGRVRIHVEFCSDEVSNSQDSASSLDQLRQQN